VFGWRRLENGYWFFVIGDWFKGKATPRPKLFGGKIDSKSKNYFIVEPPRTQRKSAIL
jgi:hypothetical protein